MTTARLRVIHAGPLVTIQDGGRRGHMRFGVAASGPMDRTAFAIANAALGQPPGAAGVEVSLGGLVLECTEGAVTLAVAGGGFAVDAGGARSGGWTVETIGRGQRLSIRGGTEGSWTYLAFAGHLRARQWLGHSATHSLSNLGGGALTPGQVLEVEQAEVRANRAGAIPRPAAAAPGAPIHVVSGPQDRFFEPAALDTFVTAPFRLTDAYDRMGVRLKGPALTLREALSIPSEPVLRGAVQVSGDGVPTVLLADHQTTGGYPKIATLIAADVDRFVQMRAGDTVRFAAITPAESIAMARAAAARTTELLEAVSMPRGSLAERLLRENLISGAISGAEE